MLQKHKTLTEILMFCHQQGTFQPTYRKPVIISIGGFKKFRFSTLKLLEHSRLKMPPMIEFKSEAAVTPDCPSRTTKPNPGIADYMGQLKMQSSKPRIYMCVTPILLPKSTSVSYPLKLLPPNGNMFPCDKANRANC